MRGAFLASETDIDGFLRQAAHFLASGVEPEAIVWSVGEARDLFAACDTASDAPPSAESAPAPAFAAIVRLFLLHSDPQRFALAYRLLWRSLREPHLLQILSDRDVSRARLMASAVSRDLHKMKAFVRFRAVDLEDGEAYVAWFEPQHHIVAAVAPFFVGRFATMAWSILTPRASAHWDLTTLTIAEGAARGDAPDGDALESLWRTYFASIFNPARLNVKAMERHMPKRYWKNMPEASMIAPLTQLAPRRHAEMIEAARPPRPQEGAPREPEAADPEAADPEAADYVDLDALTLAQTRCKRCPLYEPATQVVSGEGPARATLMFVGEQPGDQEDLAGRPFIGPAGKLLDTALQRVGIDRAGVFVTNAVKHFKFEPRGKRRLHKKPEAPEIDACRWWLDHERAFVRPRLIVALGASAMRGVTGKSAPLLKSRGVVRPLDDETHFLATVHPSYLLRLQEERDKREQWALFLEDLKTVKEWIGRNAAESKNPVF